MTTNPRGHFVAAGPVVAVGELVLDRAPQQLADAVLDQDAVVAGVGVVHLVFVVISLMDAQVGRDVTYDGRIFVVHGSFSRFSRYEATEPDLGLI